MRFLVVFCLAAAVSFPGTANAQRQFRIVGKSSGLVLTVRGAQIFQEARQTGNTLQRWGLRPVSPGSTAFRIINPATGLAMEAPGVANKTPVRMVTVSTSDTQFWLAEYSKDGIHFKLLPLRSPDKAMDVPGDGRIRKHIQIYSDNGKDHQLWSLE